METGLVSIEIAAKLHSIGIDISSLKRQYFIEGELKPEEVLRILKDNGFRARQKKLKTIEGLQKYPAPLIFMSNDGTYHVLLGRKEEKVLVFDCLKKGVTELTNQEFASMWNGDVIALYPRFTKTDFYLNFRWLFREFLRYKSIF